MYRFYGSTNSRYFAADKGGLISFYNKNGFSWFTEQSAGKYSIAGVGNNGCVAMVIDDKIRLFQIDRRGESETLDKFSSEILGKTSSHLDDVQFDQEGTRLCVCRCSSKSTVSEKLFGALASVPAEKGLKEFEILLYDIDSKKSRSLYKTVQPASQENYFKWAISSDFRYLIVRNPRKTQTGVVFKYSVMEAATQKPITNFELQDFDIQKLTINMERTVFMDAFHKGVHFIVIITKDKTSYKVTPPANSEILHFARSYVAFLASNPTVLQARSFENSDLARVSLTSLDELGIQYGILFSATDSIVFLYFEKEELRIVPTELCSFVTEVKRCELTTQQRAGLINTPVEPEPQIRPEAGGDDASLRIVKKETVHPISPGEYQARDMMEEHLGITSRRENDAPPKKEKSPAHPDKIDIPAQTVDYIRLTKSDHYKILESLKLQLVMGIIDEDEYAEKKATVERRIKQYEVIFEEPEAAEEDEEEEAEEEAAEEEAPSEEKYTGYDEDEARRIQNLLETLQDRYMHGEISEETYRENKARYQHDLNSRKRQDPPSKGNILKY